MLTIALHEKAEKCVTEKKKRTVIQTPLGRMLIEGKNGAIERVSFTDEELLPATDELLQRAEKQLLQYFAGERCTFDLPVRMKGTAFQMAAWKALREIPYGETVTYGQQAEMMGHPKACRAVGGANHQNRLLILVPCHRVVAKGGMGGFGAGIEKKLFLLELEKKNIAKYAPSGAERSENRAAFFMEQAMDEPVK